MNFFWLRIAAAMIGTGALAWEDRRSGLMDSRIIFGMLSLGLLLGFGLTPAIFFSSLLVAVALVLLAAFTEGKPLLLFGEGDLYLVAALQMLYPVSFGLIPFSVCVLAFAFLFYIFLHLNCLREWVSVEPEPFGPYVFMGLLAALLAA